MLRYVTIPLLLLCLGACATSSAISPSTSFVPGRDAKGLMVVGVSASRYATFLGATAWNSVGDFQLTWTRLENGVAPPKPMTVRLYRSACGLLAGAGAAKCDLRRTTWQVLHVEPGDYQLSEIQTWQQTGTTMRVTTTRMLDTAGLVIRVAAGEVVYLGDFSIDLLGGPARIVRDARNDAAAQSAIAALPRIAPGPLAFRPPIGRARFLAAGDEASPVIGANE